MIVGAAASAGGHSNVNKAIQQLAQKYCGEARASFDELSKIIQVQSLKFLPFT